MGHGHNEDGDKCAPSDTYNDYIQKHIQDIRAKCHHLMNCINRLLEDESPLKVLKGEPLDLNKTCGLVHKDDSGIFKISYNRCTEGEREDIREDIEDHLKENFVEMPKGWNKVKTCLQNSYGDRQKMSYVDKICGIARDEPQICKNAKAHSQAETFFNDQIQHLKCHCNQLEEADEGHSHSDNTTSALIGAGAAGLSLIFIFLVLFLCYRRRKRKQKKKRAQNVIYLPAPNEDCPVYQEVYDYRSPNSRSQNPPTLPMRYTPHPTGPRPGIQDNEPAYLEPIEVGSSRHRPRTSGPKISNPGYDLPPEYTEKPEPRQELTTGDVEDGYFQPLPHAEDTLRALPPVPQEDSSRPMSSPYDTIADLDSGESVPLEIAPPAPVEVAPSKPLGPVPAKRTKKGDHQTESQYYLLEKLRENNADTKEEDEVAKEEEDEVTKEEDEVTPLSK